MNDASTRSHCMFILWVDTTKPDSDTVLRAKLHLVDLAGSERISKTGVEGKLQREAHGIRTGYGDGGIRTRRWRPGPKPDAADHLLTSNGT